MNMNNGKLIKGATGDWEMVIGEVHATFLRLSRERNETAN
jgi:hypothetical protein